MTFVSYAQNFEDVVLWRALKGISNGMYVDVGAQHPVVDSVSKAFYERGWRGIHIEPVKAYAELLRADRPDEIVLEVALGAAVGTIDMHVFPATGLSTAVAEHASRHVEEGGFEAQRVVVPVLTLEHALTSLSGQEVHWLKIDVEGFEEQVLRGWNSRTLRPWVMVVEATIPGSRETDYAGWDDIITGADYNFVYFDGLNRFYLADEHAELRDAFAVPPNIFDDIQLSGQGSWSLCGKVAENGRALIADAALAHQRELNGVQTAMKAIEMEFGQARQAHAAALAECARVRTEAERLHAASMAEQAELHAAAMAEQAELLALACEQDRKLVEEAANSARALDDLRMQLAAAHALTHQWWTVADRFNHQLQAVHASHSWRLTAPLRKVANLLRWLARLPGRIARALWRRSRHGVRRAMEASMGGVVRHPRLEQTVRAFLNRVPGASRLVRAVAHRAGVEQPSVAEMRIDTATRAAETLSPRASRLLVQINHALKERHN